MKILKAQGFDGIKDVYDFGFRSDFEEVPVSMVFNAKQAKLAAEEPLRHANLARANTPAPVRGPEEPIPVQELRFDQPKGAETGKPITIDAYRASTEPQFRPNESRGTFFAPEATPEFGNHIYRAKLKFDNPLVGEDGAELARSLGDEALAKRYEDLLSGWDSEKDAPLEGTEFEGTLPIWNKADADLVKLARKSGHDGIVFFGHDDLNPVQYIAVDPKAIDATKVGEFDSASGKVQPESDFTSDPAEFVDEDFLPPDEEEGDRGMWHATTAMDKVLKEGLKSRKQTGGMGLGGGWKNDAPDKVSVTFDQGHAQSIAERMKLAAQAARDEITPEVALNRMIQDADLADDTPYEIAKALDAPEDIRNSDNWEDFEAWFKETYPHGTAYDLVQELDDKLPEIFEGAERPVRVGLTASKSEMAKVDPEQIGVVRVQARKGAKAQHIPDEAEIRFHPQDLRLHPEEH